MNYFEYKLFQFCKTKNLLAEKKRYLLSVSGGVDSVALFYLFRAFLEKISIDIAVVHFNHAVRNESDEEQLFVEKLAKENNLPFFLFHADDIFADGQNFQNKARNWRKNTLLEIKETKHYDFIVQAHHLNDLVETQLWKISKGVSLFGLNPLKLQNDCWLHPLIETPKQKLITYLKEKKISWRDDHSNFQSKYTRNKIRNEIIPLLSFQSEPAYLKKMLALAKESEELNQYFEQNFKSLHRNQEIEYHQIQALPKIFAYEMIHRFVLYHAQVRIKRWHIKKIYQCIERNIGGWKIDLGLHFQLMGEKNSIKCKQKN